jgi:hypothetical protein
MERPPLLIDWQNQNCENGYITECNLHVHCNIHENHVILQREKNQPKIHMKAQKTLNSENSP